MLKHMLTSTTPGPRAHPAVPQELSMNGGVTLPSPRHLHHLQLNSSHHHHHPHNTSALSPQQLNLSIQSHRLNHSHALSTLSTSKHSLCGNSSSVSPGAGVSLGYQPALSLIQSPPPQIISPVPKLANGGLHIPKKVLPSTIPITALPSSTEGRSPKRRGVPPPGTAGVREMLTSLGLLCLVSLLLALLALIFLLKISPAAEVYSGSSSPRGSGVGLSAVTGAGEQHTIVSLEEYVVVYEVTLALCALTLSLNLCCLLVCAIQFLFAVKLTRATHGGDRTNKYLQKSSATRVCAVGGFFVSIPVFLTGIILYTFIQFHSTPAIITSVFIGLGIIFCGCAMVHNVFVWQREKTNAIKLMAAQQQQQLSAVTGASTSGATSPDAHRLHLTLRQDTPASPTMPPATLDLSALSVNPHELSTLV